MRTEQQTRAARRIVAALVILGAAGSLAAAHGPYRIKALRADAYSVEGAWRATIEYDVRIMSFDPEAEYQLVLYAMEHGQPVLDPDGQPLQYIVPLRQPRLGKHGEYRFIGQADASMLAAQSQHLKHLRVRVTLVTVGEDRTLAEKQTGVKVHKHHARE